jgi:hypothetical protein
MGVREKRTKDVRQKGLSEAIAMLRIFSRRKATEKLLCYFEVLNSYLKERWWKWK